MVLEELVIESDPTWLRCSEEHLKPFLTHPSHHELMQFSGGRDVELRVGDEINNWSNEKDRTLIEALLIQSRGSTHKSPCSRCARGLGPFTDCRTVKGWFEGTCGNCKKGGNSMACTLNIEARALSRDLEAGRVKDWRPEHSRAAGKRNITVPERYGSV